MAISVMHVPSIPNSLFVFSLKRFKLAAIENFLINFAKAKLATYKSFVNFYMQFLDEVSFLLSLESDNDIKKVI